MKKEHFFRIGILAVITLIFSLGSLSCKTKEPAPPPEIKKEAKTFSLKDVDNFLNELQKWSEDPKKRKEYWETVNKLATVVKDEAKRNPEGMQSFLQDMVNLAVKAGPGLALQVEDYASSQVKQEIKELRQEIEGYKTRKDDWKTTASKWRTEWLQKRKHLQKELQDLQSSREEWKTTALRLEKELLEAKAELEKQKLARKKAGSKDVFTFSVSICRYLEDYLREQLQERELYIRIRSATSNEAKKTISIKANVFTKIFWEFPTSNAKLTLDKLLEHSIPEATEKAKAAHPFFKDYNVDIELKGKPR